MKQATEHEIAQVRLEAWKAISGWGITKDEKIELWNWDERKKRARELADWALET